MTSSTCVAIDASTTHCMMDAVYLDSTVTTTFSSSSTLNVTANELTGGFFAVVFLVFLVVLLVFANVWKR